MKSSLDAVAFARALINIDSTTGREAEAGRWLSRELRERGYTVVEQPVDGGRANVFASIEPPEVVFSTHYDCVPPFFPSRVDNGRLYEHRVGLLFVVGEERGSDGAAVANTAPGGSRFLINGEPTDNRLGTGTRGVLRLRLRAEGRAAHSAIPEHGVSAIDKLIDALVALRAIELPSDPELGSTYYSIGLIDGGIAPNVISPHASAEVLFRTVGPVEDILRAVQPLDGFVTSEEVLRVPVVKLHTVPGFPTAAFRFTTDVPFLDRWGTPLLFGPGSILVAHTSEEHVEIAELERAVEAYERLARACLAAP